MLIAGIDVGFSGAIAIINEHSEIVQLLDMPLIQVGRVKELNETRLKNILSNGITHVFIEKAQAMPRQGVVSTGRYMMSFGQIRGICVGLGIPYTLVTPQQWKKVWLQGYSKEKGSSVVRVKQLYPELELPRKKDHNKADALLIALWGYRFLTK